MKYRYEALLVLDIEGKEETVQDMIDTLIKEFAEEGATVEQVQKMEKRSFAYAPGRLEAGYFTNFIFEGESHVVPALQARLKLRKEVYKQSYLKLEDAVAKA